jgi:hypothetical protein
LSFTLGQGLFRGLGTTIARVMPGYFFFFGGYEATRGLLTPIGKTKDEIGMKLCILLRLIVSFYLKEKIENICYIAQEQKF